MFKITLDPIIFSIGHLHLRWYSLIVLTAIIVGVWLLAREAARKGFKKGEIRPIAGGSPPSGGDKNSPVDGYGWRSV